MITLSYGNAFFFYVLIWLIAIAVLCLREFRRVRNNFWETGNRKLFECGSCHYSYLGSDESNVSRCPRCNAICFRRVKK